MIIREIAKYELPTVCKHSFNLLQFGYNIDTIAWLDFYLAKYCMSVKYSLFLTVGSHIGFATSYSC